MVKTKPPDESGYKPPEVVRVSGVARTERSVRLDALTLRDGTRVEVGWARLLEPPPPPNTVLVDIKSEIKADKATGRVSFTTPLMLEGRTEIVVSWARLVL